MSTDSLRQSAILGKALENELVIDAHMHINRYHNFFMPSAEIADLITNAKRLGIKRLFASSLLAIRNDAIAGNQEVLDAHRNYPELFEPYLVVKPNYPEEIPAILELSSKFSIRQFKLHDDANGYPYDHKNYFPLYEYCNANKCVVLFHTFGKMHLLPIQNVARSFPGIKILLGHSGIFDENCYYEAVRQHENIYLETCNSMAWYGLIERMVSNAGAERVIFGSDMPFMSPDQQIGRVLFARISDEAKRKILGLNARQLFELDIK